jgi:hypothetical protein
MPMNLSGLLISAKYVVPVVPPKFSAPFRSFLHTLKVKSRNDLFRPVFRAGTTGTTR